MSELLNNNLRQRIVSALVLVPAVLGLVWVGGAFFIFLILAAMVIGMMEWLRLTAPPHLPLRGRVWAYGVLFLLLLIAVGKGMGQAALLSLLAALVLGFYSGKGEAFESGWKERAAWCAAGIPYIVWSGISLIFLRNNPAYGLEYITFLLLVVWGTDTGAYFAGRLIGGPKLCPKISPKKTWAGLGGGMVMAAVLGYAGLAGFGMETTGLSVLVAMALAVVSQAGDFFESYVKRRADAKDSGTLIPGHGGLLDRVDGLFFAGIALAVLVSLTGAGWL